MEGYLSFSVSSHNKNTPIHAETLSPKFRPTMQCHVGLYFLSNSFLMKAAISFSMLYFSRACSEERNERARGDWSVCVADNTEHIVLKLLVGREAAVSVRSRDFQKHFGDA
jgi:hypothetical protein